MQEHCGRSALGEWGWLFVTGHILIDPCRDHRSNTVQVCPPRVELNSRPAAPPAVVLSLAQIRAPRAVLGTVHELPVTLAVATETR